MPISVLLVDDEPLYAALLAQRLESRDFAVTVAADGDEALRAAASSPPDLALLDVNLPGKSGVEVLADLKQAGFAGEALMLTGQAGVETAVAGMKLGAADYLSKSLDFDQQTMFDQQRPMIAPVFVSEDAREGSLAFAEKRKPVWKGK